MADAATALLALWNDVTPEQDAQYNRWHAVEHVPERLTVPGILWALRYASTAPRQSPRYLTLYGLRNAQVLESQYYLQLLRKPTPMSHAMRPHLRRVSRWVCALDPTTLSATAPQLAVWTWDDTSIESLRPPEPLDDASGLRGCLLARRISTAGTLPWLQTTQQASDATICGDRLRCAGFDAAQPPNDAALAGSSVFNRLNLR